MNNKFERAALQEAAAALQQRLGDPSAVFLAASPEEGKVAMAAAVSPAAVAGGLQVADWSPMGCLTDWPWAAGLSALRMLWAQMSAELTATQST